MAQEAFAVDFIKETRKKDYDMGGRKLWYMYKRTFIGNNPLGRDRFEDVVDRYGLKVRLKIRKPKTTDFTHGLPTYPNLIKDLIPTMPKAVTKAVDFYNNERPHMNIGMMTPVEAAQSNGERDMRWISYRER